MEHNKIIDLLNSDIGVVKGIGEKKKKLLNKLKRKLKKKLLKKLKKKSMKKLLKK